MWEILVGLFDKFSNGLASSNQESHRSDSYHIIQKEKIHKQYNPKSISNILFQTCLFTSSATDEIAPVLIECPAIKCRAIGCLYGEVPTYLDNGCAGCPRCRDISECPAIDCLEFDCAYGMVSTYLENGCPSCPRCRDLSECELVYCLDFACPFGSTSGKQPNGCPGCPVCWEEPIIEIA